VCYILFRPAILTNLTIVIVEDHPDIRLYVAEFLSRQGATVIAAPNASEGLQAVSGDRPNIVLLDIKLPDRDGFELLRDIRALGPENGGDVPVIAMTAFGRTADRNRTIAAGLQAHLDKPFVPQKLLDALKSVLKD
jgi:CheY-like chemotaxis protein